jgi:hypothetical protein
MREALEKLVKTLVSDKDAVEVQERTDRSSTVFAVKVAEADMGRLIGREGRTAKAIRSLLFFAGQKSGRRYVLEIVE